MKLAWTNAVAVALLAFGAPPLAASEYVAVRFSSGSRPAVYLRFSGQTAWVAASASGLKRAQKLEALPAQTENTEGDTASEAMVIYAFPATKVPVTVSGYTGISVSSRVIRKAKGARNQPAVAVIAEVTFLKKDAAGVTWGYMSRAFASEGLSTSAASPTIMDLRLPGGLKLAVETKLNEEEKKVGIGVMLTRGGEAIETATKDDAPAPVHLEVLGTSGSMVRAVHTQDGDLSKFAFG